MFKHIKYTLDQIKFNIDFFRGKPQKVVDTPYNPREDELFWTYYPDNGEPQVIPENNLILAKLLVDDVVFIGRFDTGPFFESSVNPPEATTCIWVNCSDFFAWGCADAEPVLPNELGDLYRASKEKHGVTKWCCKRRNLKPQKPIRDRMKKAGVWDDEMEALEDNFE